MSTPARVDGDLTVLEGRYRLTGPPPPVVTPVVVDALDELLSRPVTLLLLPATSSVSGQIALRLQLRRTAKASHPSLATVLDVLDTPTGPAVVLTHQPGGRLLTDGAPLPPAGPHQLRDALHALHRLGLAHGAVSEAAILVCGGTAVLLPMPTTPSASPAVDLHDLQELVGRCASSASEPDTIVFVPLSLPATTVPLGSPHLSQPALTQALPWTHLDEPADPTPTPSTLVPDARAAQPGHRVARLRRVALVVAGGCTGALLTDIVLHLIA